MSNKGRMPILKQEWKLHIRCRGSYDIKTVLRNVRGRDGKCGWQGADNVCYGIRHLAVAKEIIRMHNETLRSDPKKASSVPARTENSNVSASVKVAVDVEGQVLYTTVPKYRGRVGQKIEWPIERPNGDLEVIEVPVIRVL